MTLSYHTLRFLCFLHDYPIPISLSLFSPWLSYTHLFIYVFFMTILNPSLYLCLLHYYPSPISLSLFPSWLCFITPTSSVDFSNPCVIQVISECMSSIWYVCRSMECSKWNFWWKTKNPHSSEHALYLKRLTIIFVLQPIRKAVHWLSDVITAFPIASLKVHIEVYKVTSSFLTLFISASKDKTTIKIQNDSVVG